MVDAQGGAAAFGSFEGWSSFRLISSMPTLAQSARMGTLSSQRLGHPPDDLIDAQPALEHAAGV